MSSLSMLFSLVIFSPCQPYLSRRSMTIYTKPLYPPRSSLKFELVKTEAMV